MILINDLKHSAHLLDIQNYTHLNDFLEPLKGIFETIYCGDENKARSEALIEKIISELISSK